MKIWTITTDDRDGCQTVVRVTEAAADAAAMAFCRKHWPKDAGPMPDDFTAAYDLIQSGDSGLIWIEEHDISGHPDLEGLMPRPSPEALCIWYEAADLANGMIRLTEDGSEFARADNPDHVALICDWMKELGEGATDAARDKLFDWVPDSLEGMQAELDELAKDRAAHPFLARKGASA